MQEEQQGWEANGSAVLTLAREVVCDHQLPLRPGLSNQPARPAAPSGLGGVNGDGVAQLSHEVFVRRGAFVLRFCRYFLTLLLEELHVPRLHQDGVQNFLRGALPSVGSEGPHQRQESGHGFPLPSRQAELLGVDPLPFRSPRFSLRAGALASYLLLEGAAACSQGIEPLGSSPV